MVAVVFKTFGRIFRASNEDEPSPKFSFCESIHATSASPWHIRRLGEAGLKLGGGIDSGSLCGRVEKSWGWDIGVKITDDHLAHCCNVCAEQYKELNK